MDVNLSKLREIVKDREDCCSPWSHRVGHEWATEQRQRWSGAWWGISGLRCVWALVRNGSHENCLTRKLPDRILCHGKISRDSRAEPALREAGRLASSPVRRAVGIIVSWDHWIKQWHWGCRHKHGFKGYLWISILIDRLIAKEIDWSHSIGERQCQKTHLSMGLRHLRRWRWSSWETKQNRRIQWEDDELSFGPAEPRSLWDIQGKMFSMQSDSRVWRLKESLGLNTWTCE